MIKVLSYVYVLLCCLFSTAGYAQAFNDEVPGQTIQIHSRLNSFLGKPTWLLEIRDVDNGEVLPYVFNFTRGNDYWIAFTYSRNYLITASTLSFETYQSRWNQYKKYKIRNFCQLESEGRIIRGESMHISITGDLSPNTDTFSCNVMRYSDRNFSLN